MTDHTGAPPGADEISSLLPYTPPPASPPARGRGVVAALVVGIVGLLAAGVFALVLATGEGGSSTPEDAVQALLDAAAQEDVVGMLDSLAPAERRAIQQPVEDLAGELRRLGVLDDGFDLRSLDGIDLEFENVEMTSELLDDDVAVVNLVSGTVRATTTPREVPVGPVVEEFLSGLDEDPFDADPETTVEDIASEDVHVATIRDGGRWYVSLFYSVAEAARVSSSEQLPDFDTPVPAVGAASPEAAVEEMVRAALALDARRLVELSPPDEMAVLHDYAPLFLDDAETAVAELRARGPFELRLDRLDLDTDGDGDVAVVSASAFAVSGTLDGEPVEVTYDGDCLHARGQGEDLNVCTSDYEEQMDEISLPEGLRGMTLHVRVVNVDGAWYVSPTRTVLGAIVDILRAIERDELTHALEGFQNMFFYGLFGASGYQSESFEEIGGSVEVAPLEPHQPLPENPFRECWALFDDLGPESTPDERDAAERELQACMERSASGAEN